ncbi:MAG TPA: hypothetical protein VIE89_31225 [Candidatus Binatia bacterium]
MITIYSEVLAAANDKSRRLRRLVRSLSFVPAGLLYSPVPA